MALGRHAAMFALIMKVAVCLRSTVAVAQRIAEAVATSSLGARKMRIMENVTQVDR